MPRHITLDASHTFQSLPHRSMKMSSSKLPRVFPVSENEGKLTLSRLDAPNDSIYVVSWDCPPDNRITPAFVEALLQVLDFVVEHVPRTAVLVTTSAISKFYCNGLNVSERSVNPVSLGPYLAPISFPECCTISSSSSSTRS